MTYVIFHGGGAGEGQDTPVPQVTLLAGQVASVENSVSSIISEFLPDFVRQNHSTFVAFIEAYYEWMEQKANPLGTSITLMDTLDIDKTLDSFVEYFKNNYLQSFPKEFATMGGNTVNEKTVMKNIKDFYKSKGSEKAYKFLFRILHDSDVQFYYPKKDILRVSDGKWVENKSIKITSTNGTSNFSMKNKRVEQIDASLGSNVTAYANVDKVYQYQLRQYSVTELFLVDINGTFTQGSAVRCILDDGTELKENIYTIPSEIIISGGGVGYRSADVINIDDSTSDYISGIGAKGKVSKVDNDGTITSANIDNFGVDYRATNNKTTLPIVFKSASGSGATGHVNINALCTYPGYFANNDGKVSSNKKIRDNNLYQEYSYLLKAEVGIDKYKNQIKNLVHPAGTKMFGNVSLMNSLSSLIPYSTKITQNGSPVIGRYLPYTLETHDNLIAATGADGSTPVDLYPAGFNPGSTASDHCLGNTGGRLSIEHGHITGGYTIGSFTAGITLDSHGGGCTGTVFGWHRSSSTGGVLFVYTHGGGTALGFTVGNTFEAQTGQTGHIRAVTVGNGTVLEHGNKGHTNAAALLYSGALTAGADNYGATAYWDVKPDWQSSVGTIPLTLTTTDFTDTSAYTAGWDYNIGNVVTQGDVGNLSRGIVKDWITGHSGGTGSILKIEKTSGQDFVAGTITEINTNDGSEGISYTFAHGGTSGNVIRNKIKHLKLDDVVRTAPDWEFDSAQTINGGYTV
jgi:hypothetical protein